MVKKPERSIEDIFSEDNRYPFEAVQFVREGLNHSVAKFHADGGESGTVRHVSGPQLCTGLRELALNRWGMMARSVLEKWNIKQTRDFGEIVFLLVDNGWMQKEPSDQIDDFDNVYDFKEAFRQGFNLSLDN